MDFSSAGRENERLKIRPKTVSMALSKGGERGVREWHKAISQSGKSPQTQVNSVITLITVDVLPGVGRWSEK